MTRTSHASILLAALALLVVFQCATVRVNAAAISIYEDTFDNLKNSNVEKVVLFYRSSDPSSIGATKIIKQAAKIIRKTVPHMEFYKCDGDLSINQKEFQEAQFNSGVFVFTSTHEHGIEKYPHELNAQLLARHVIFKFSPAASNDVHAFVDEDSFYDRMDLAKHPKPIFVKFYEESCIHCQRLKKTYQRAASVFKDRVDFFEVECSRNDETMGFCTKSHVRSYPTLVLFTGEEKITYEEADRGIISLEKFFDKHVKAAPSQSDEDGEVEETAAAPAGLFAKPEAPAGVFSKPATPTATKTESVTKATSEKHVSSQGESAELSAAKERIASLEEKIAQMEMMMRKLVKPSPKDEL